MKNNKLTIIKLIVGAVSIGATVATSIISKKEFDMKVAEKVSETLAKTNEEA